MCYASILLQGLNSFFFEQSEAMRQMHLLTTLSVPLFLLDIIIYALPLPNGITIREIE